MIEQIRRFLSSTGGKVLTIVLALGVVTYLVFIASDFLHGDTPEGVMYVTYIDPENGKSFKHKNAVGESVPLQSPFSGKKTALPAEACYWNKDGSIKSDPTWLLLNSQIGKPDPTFCPDCGRLVVARNPKPDPGSPLRPPPTKQEWLASHSNESP